MESVYKFGEILKELRKEENLTQEHISKLLDVNRSNVANYESGKRLPPIDSLIKIAQFFNVSLDYLILGKKSSREPLAHDPGTLGEAERSLMAENTALMESVLKLTSKMEKQEEEIRILREYISSLHHYTSLLEDNMKKLLQ